MPVRNLQWVLSGRDKDASKAFSKVERSADKLQDKFRGLSAKGLGAAGLGAGIGAALTKGLFDALDVEKAQDKLAAQLGAGSPLAAEAGKAAGRLYVNAYGESVAETGAAVRAALAEGLIDEDATAAQMEAVTGRVLDVASVFDQEVSGIARAVGQMLKNDLAPNAESALDVITRGFQQNVNKADDLVDTLNEYGTQFRELGLTGPDAMGLLSQGLQAGARDADTVADALKEFAIRAQDGSETSAEGFRAIKLDAKAMTKAIAKGGPDAKKALDQVLDGLRDIEDPAERNAAAVALFGTKAEDLQDALFALDLDKAARGLGNVEGAAKRAGDELNNNAATKVEAFKRRVQTGFVDWIGNEVVPAAEKFADEFKNGVGPGGEFKDVLADMRDVGKDLAPIVKDVAGFTGDLIGWFADHPDAAKTFAIGIAAYATAMKAAAIWTGAMAAIDLFKLAAGISAVNAAGGAGATGGAAGGKGKGGKAGKFARSAGIGGIIGGAIVGLDQFLPESLQMDDNATLPLAPRPKPKPVTVAPRPGGSSLDRVTTVNPTTKTFRDQRTSGALVLQNNLSGHKVTDAVSSIQVGRAGRGYLGPS